MKEEVEARDILLAMDTSGDVCSVAVLRAGQFVAEHTFRHGMHLSERLMGHLDAILQDAEATLEEVAAFAVGLGPGSFTGTRIGVMTIKTLAAVLDKPVVGIGSLDAVAAQYGGVVDLRVVPLLPCRTGVVYSGVYAVDGPIPQRLLEPAAFPLADLAECLMALEPRSVLFCGAATERYQEELQSLLSQESFSVSFGEARFPRAAHVAQLAQDRLHREPAGEDVMALVPLYISPPPITLPKQEIPQPKEN